MEGWEPGALHAHVLEALLQISLLFPITLLVVEDYCFRNAKFLLRVISGISAMIREQKQIAHL